MMHKRSISDLSMANKGHYVVVCNNSYLNAALLDAQY